MKLEEITLLFPRVKNSPLCARASAGTRSSLWCPDIPHCCNLPSSAAPLHRAGPHNAQMVAIVLPRPLPHSVEQEALLCMPEGQEAWLTSAEPVKSTQGHFYVYTFLTCQSKQSFCIVLSYFVIDNRHSILCSSLHTHCVCGCF